MRSRYVDTLRALAIARVFLHHSLWLGWLTVVFPSMPVMFALAGMLMAASLERGGPLRVLAGRSRRLLLPFWAFGLVALPLMLLHGWPGLNWSDLVYWVVPLANPPSSDWGGPFTLALWYLRAYLWMMLLSPLLWWAFKRRPLLTLAVPALSAVVLASPLVVMPSNRVMDVVWSTAAYGSCWVLGFARHTGLLDRLRPWVCGLLAAALCAAGVAWGFVWSPENPWGNQLADLLWGFGFVLVLMRARPSMAWLESYPRLAAAVSVVNARAVTIYVWHLPMLFATTGLLMLLRVDPAQGVGKPLTVLIGGTLTAAAVVCVGWIEDVAARRKPVLAPVPRPQRPPAEAGELASIRPRELASSGSGVGA